MTETVALRPSLHSSHVIEAVARTIIGDLTNRGGYSEETAAKHVEKLLSERRFEDGYRMTRRLEQDFGWFNCDMRTAEVMDDAYTMLLTEVRRKTEEWVAKNAIKPKKVIGDAVHFKYHGEPLDGEIVGINHSHAQYIICVPALGHVHPAEGKPGTEGLIVNFEDIHDLVEPPEHFELRVQE